MSAYRKLATKYTSRQHLRTALKAAGIEFEETRPGQPEKHLVGWKNKTRPETCTFIVRRSQISSASNDIGWHWNAQARRFEEIVSEYDQSCKSTTTIRNTVRREYAVATATSAAKQKGYRVKRVEAAGGGVQLVVTGRI